MEEERGKRRNHWAHRFPAVDGEWPYWWIEGESVCIGVIDGGNLSAAVDIIEDHWESYGIIKAYKAKIVDRDIMRREERSAIIFNRSNSNEFESE